MTARRRPQVLIGCVALGLLSASSARATRQTPEHLIIDGDPDPMVAEPLGSHPRLDEIRRKLGFKELASNCRRGYVGTWEIDKKTLYLVRLDSCGMRQRADLKRVFGSKRVRARWFTGVLRVPGATWNGPVHEGSQTVYQYEQRIQIRKGKVVHQSTDKTVRKDWIGNFPRRKKSEPLEAYGDGILSVYGLRKRSKRTLGKRVTVRAWVTEINECPPCPEHARCPACAVRQLWVSDEKNGGKELMLCEPPHPLPFKKGLRYDLTGKFTKRAPPGFTAADGLLIYERHRQVNKGT